MRPDMAKVIVERPRVGSRAGSKRKGYDREQRRAGWEGRAGREGMRRRSGHGKHFNEHLGPLRRFLLSRVGHPWDKVFSEICAHINRNSAVQDHVRDHVVQLVVTHVVLIDGVACSGAGGDYGRPLHSGRWWRQFYVCPRTGLLRRVKELRQHSRPAPSPPPVRVSGTLQCHYLDGAWHLVTLAPLPAEPWRAQCTRRDVVIGKKVSELTPETAQKVYGAALYATGCRRLGKAELRQWPIPADAR
jgi:hypothetical protein